MPGPVSDASALVGIRIPFACDPVYCNHCYTYSILGFMVPTTSVGARGEGQRGEGERREQRGLGPTLGLGPPASLGPWAGPPSLLLALSPIAPTEVVGTLKPSIIYPHSPLLPLAPCERE